MNTLPQIGRENGLGLASKLLPLLSGFAKIKHDVLLRVPARSSPPELKDQDISREVGKTTQ